MSEGAPRAPRTLSSALPWLGLVAIAALAWAFLVASERRMRAMDGIDMRGGMGSPAMHSSKGEGAPSDSMAGMADMAGAGQDWIGGLMHHAMNPDAALPYFAASALMWIVMMIAMMVPAVTPMARAVERAQAHEGRPFPGWFAGGYLGAWAGFGVLAAALQWGLHRAGWLGGPTLSAAPWLAGGLLVGAGLYQWSPWKDVCLIHCRSPIGFLLEHWRPGRGGALHMGLHHGLYCVGCCWVLMLLMFAGGAMSVVVMAALCVLILAERVLPDGPWVTRIPGALLVLSGVAVWIHAGA